MDPFSTSAAVLQVIGQCAICSVALAKWIAQVKTVDRRLEEFAREVSSLQQTHENLQQSLQIPHMIEAAKSTNDASGQLWSQIDATLNDCQTTLVAINQTLEKISKPSMFGKPMRQLQESLHSGELSRYFHRIQNFNILLQLPLQMVTISLQLSQQETNQINHQELAHHIVSVRDKLVQMDDRIKKLRPNQSNTRRYSLSPSSTLVEMQADKFMYDNLEKCVAKAQSFISSASTVASARSTSAGSAIQSDIRPALTRNQRSQINSWVGMPQNKPPTPAASESESSPALLPQNGVAETPDEGVDQVNLKLARIFVEHGQLDIEQEQFAAAEENFREALEVLKKHDFGQMLAFEPADIQLLLARCCFHQDNCAEAIALLRPIATSTQSSTEPDQSKDPLRMLTANHLLGQAYLQMKDHDNAEKHAYKAFEGRLERLREQDPSFLESVQLMVTIYRAMGREAKARAFSHWLSPKETTSPRQRTVSHTSEASTQFFLATRSATLPVADVQNGLNNQAGVMPVVSTQPNRLPAQTHPTPLVANRSTSFALPSPFCDDASTSTEITQSSTKLSEVRSGMRRPLEPKFQAIKEIAINSKEKAVSAGMKLLKGYDPNSRILILRTDEIKKNLRKRATDLGLAATGQGYAPIHFFCELPEECVAELEILIEAGVDLGAICHKAAVPGRDPMTPLQITIEKEHTNMSRVIIGALTKALSKGKPVPDVNTMYGRDGLPPLLSACRRGQVTITAQLLEYGARVMHDFPDAWYGNSLLHDSCQRCDTEMVKMLLGYQDLNDWGSIPSIIGFIGQQDELGKTPLTYAVMTRNVMADQREKKLSEQYECIELLLQHGSSHPNFEKHLYLTDNKGVDVFGYADDEADKRVQDLLDRYAKISQNSAVNELE